MKGFTILLTVFLCTTCPPTESHPGRTASDGCHYCRTNCTSWGVPYNERHCHNASVTISKTSTTSNSYNRDNWKHWIDTDGDCQNVRHELLIQQSLETVSFTNIKQCTVSTGKWVDPFTNKVWLKASDLDTDHVVPLKWAYDHGGKIWTKELKQQFANDTDNLLLVEDNLNSEKGASGPLNWMPPLLSFHCRYLKSWDLLIKRYDLSASIEERQFITHKLVSCNN